MNLSEALKQTIKNYYSIVFFQLILLIFIFPAFHEQIFAQDIITSEDIVLRVRGIGSFGGTQKDEKPNNKFMTPAKGKQTSNTTSKTTKTAGKSNKSVSSNKSQSASNKQGKSTNKSPESNQPKTVSGGVLSKIEGDLPAPKYPGAARAVGASGAVNVQVLIDENGDVVSATAVSGHPLLRQAAENAALEAHFEPITLDGQPVKVSGIIVYNFIK